MTKPGAPGIGFFPGGGHGTLSATAGRVLHPGGAWGRAMKKRFVGPGLLACAWMAHPPAAGAASAPETAPPLTHEAFVQPPPAWRSVPFWSLNDVLDPAEIGRQMEAFKAGGFGGAYLHSRIGLLTEYLGPDWWIAMDAGVRAAERLGIEAWFYDEDKWPSGFAGGIVPLASEDYHARALLRLDKAAPLPERAEVLAEDGAFRYVCWKVPMGDAWFNGTCWVDLMNPATVKAFIDCSYRPYAERYAKQMGASVHGIFTDEPQVSPRPSGVAHKGAVAYSPVLRDRFRREHGYDFVDRIAGLFENVGEWAPVRLHYYQTVGRALEESFSKQIGDYCERTGMTWTGHYNGEDAFRSVQMNVGNMMIQYRHMQRPGIDHLGLRLPVQVVYMMRSLSSVANQYGRTRRLSEMFGISGQNMNFEDRAWICGGHAVLGVNHVCPHLSLYSMKGCRKRDYPPTISPQQPYWTWNGVVEDCMARICYLSSVGAYAPEVLVINPLESAYIDDPGAGASPGGNARFVRLMNVLGSLQASHRDYDLGDEQILADIGMVEGATLRVGEMAYPAVLLPCLRTVRASTLALLDRFAAAGGTVFVAGGAPDLVDGLTNAAALAALGRVAKSLPEEGAGPALAAMRPAAVRVDGEGAENVWTHRRALPGGQVVMFFNRSRLSAADVQVTLAAGADHPVVWDPASGRTLTAKPGADGAFTLRLDPARTLFLSTGSASGPARPAGAYAPRRSGVPVKTLEGPWTGRRLDPNAITLDSARWSTNGGATFHAAEPVIGIHERFTHRPYRGPLRLAFDVLAEVPPARCSLVMEQPAMYRSVQVNGRAVDFPGAGFYRDASFRVAEIGALREGTNTVTLDLDYVAPVPASREARERYGTEIESLYLVGDFAVAAEVAPEPARSERNDRGELPRRPVHRFRSFRLVAERTDFKGDLAPQGYPFYAGAFELEQSFTVAAPAAGARHVLTFPDVEAIVAVVELNGKRLPPAVWSPWEVDVTEALREGPNTLKVTLVNSLRNLLGPHHHAMGELTSVGPVSFTGGVGWPTNLGGERDWYDIRLTREPKLWRDDTQCIPFGFLSPPVLERREQGG